MRRRTHFNPKRRIQVGTDSKALERIACSLSYVGNPAHKRNPGDFGLTPPAQPRADKTLCDVARIFSRHEATTLLIAGVRKGLISERKGEQYPQNIWAVTADGLVLEAQLDNEQQGTYHGYPMPEADPFREVVLARWKQS